MTMLQLAFGIFSFAAAAIANAAAALVVQLAHSERRLGIWLVLAFAMSTVWAGAYAFMLWMDSPLVRWLPALDAAHLAAWCLVVIAILRSSLAAKPQKSFWRAFAAGALVLASVVAVSSSGLGILSSEQVSRIGTIGLAILGLLTIEQVYRNSDPKRRVVLRPLCLSLAAVFGVEVVAYSQVVLFESVHVFFWIANGIANACAAPFILWSLKHQPRWDEGLFISRQVVFYSAGLLGSCAYLLIMLAASLMIGNTIAWAPWLRIGVIALAVFGLLSVWFSSAARARFRVFIAKHFYRNRYDYREVWLKLSSTLAGTKEPGPLANRSVKALADIIGSRRGELWLASAGSGDYDGHGSWGMPKPKDALSRDSALMRFLEETRWVIDTSEYLSEPAKYANAFASDSRYIDAHSIIVPLIHENELIGVVRLDRPKGLGSLSFEDHDLLKTAGQQVAIFLVQERSQEELSQTRQFEAFSKLTAFLMHDLKNLIAQQDLVVGNAKRFKHRPDFIDDAFQTIESSVQRMKLVLERLQKDSKVEKSSLIDLSKLLAEVCAACADRTPVPTFDGCDSIVRVAVDKDRLSMAVTHAVRNAQDATPGTGIVELRLSVHGDRAVVDVKDTGGGMDQEFIRERLFRPFDSTKGARGMGIGAYQIRETMRVAGGDVEVTSTPGSGTVVRLSLPLARHLHGISRKTVA